VSTLAGLYASTKKRKTVRAITDSLIIVLPWLYISRKAKRQAYIFFLHGLFLRFFIFNFYPSACSGHAFATGTRSDGTSILEFHGYIKRAAGQAVSI